MMAGSYFYSAVCLCWHHSVYHCCPTFLLLRATSIIPHKAAGHIPPPLLGWWKNVTTWVQSTFIRCILCKHFTVKVLQKSILTAFGSILIRLCSGSLLCSDGQIPNRISQAKSQISKQNLKSLVPNPNPKSPRKPESQIFITQISNLLFTNNHSECNQQQQQ